MEESSVTRMEIDEAGEEHEPVALPRAKMIEQLRQEISERQEQLSQLEKAHKAHTHKARMLLDARPEYKKWDAADTPRWGIRKNRKRDNVLLALRSEHVPPCMMWSSDSNFFTYTLNNDRDILLARLELDDFESTFLEQPFAVPHRFRKDKDIMLAIVAKNPDALQFASKTLKNDQDVVLAAIKNKIHTAPLAIRFASSQLQNMKKIVRVALNQDHGIRAVPFISPKLQSDKTLILSSIRKSSDCCNRCYEVLSELPETLREDEDIVLAAIAKRGSNLRFASVDLRDDLDVALTACQKDGASFMFIPGFSDTKEILMEPEYLRVIIANGGYAALSDKVAARIVSNKELLTLAVENTPYTRIENIEKVFHDDLPFLLELVALNATIFPWLPDELKQNEEVARACLESDSLNEETANSAVKHNPSLFNDKELMMSAATRGLIAVFKQAPESVINDKEIMMAACGATGTSFFLCSMRLRRDSDVVIAAISSGDDSNPVIFAVSQEMFSEFPTIAEAAIQYYEGDEYARLETHFPEAVFHQRRVLLAWLEKDDWPLPKRWYQILQHGNHTKDQEILQAIAKRRGCLQYIGCDDLLQDKEFVKSTLLATDGRLLMNLKRDHAEWRWDFDIMLIAIGRSRMSLYECYHEGPTVVRHLSNFAIQVRERLAAADCFVLTFLRGIADCEHRAPPSLRCHLPTLDQGGADVKRIIAQFADIPLRKELSLLRSAAANLEYWGY